MEKSALNNRDLSGLLDEVVTGILAVVKPVKIILFGSAASGKMEKNSDLDLLVVMPDGTHRRETAKKIHRALASLGIAKDIIVVTENDLKLYGDNFSLIIQPALTEGKELYRAVA